ncbi:MAG: hypothetical protein RSP_26410 [Rhodanobacter sp.]
MKHGAIEFAGSNAMQVISCLSPHTSFAEGMNLNQGSFNFSYGTPDRGGNVSVTFEEDRQLGGTVLRISADGY